MEVKRVLSLLAVLLLTVGSVAIPVYADGANTNDVSSVSELYNQNAGDVGGDRATDSDFANAAASVIGDNSNLYKTDNEGNNAYRYSVQLNGKTVYVREETARKIINQYKISKAGTNGYSEIDDAKAQVKSMTEGLNLQGDVGTATTALAGFQGIVSTLVGVIIVGITILVVLVTTCDICYISLPMFRESQDTNNKGWNGILNRLITQEARYSVKTCTMDSGKNPLAMYLGKRVISYILLAIALFILLTGNIGLIIDIVLTGISGIVDALKSLGGAV